MKALSTLYLKATEEILHLDEEPASKAGVLINVID